MFKNLFFFLFFFGDPSILSGDPNKWSRPSNSKHQWTKACLYRKNHSNGGSKQVTRFVQGRIVKSDLSIRSSFRNITFVPPKKTFRFNILNYLLQARCFSRAGSFHSSIWFGLSKILAGYPMHVNWGNQDALCFVENLCPTPPTSRSSFSIYLYSQNFLFVFIPRTVIYTDMLLVSETIDIE